MFFLNPFRTMQDEKKMHERRAKAVLADKKPWPGLKPPGGKRDIGIIAKTFVCENPLAEMFPKVPKDGLIYKERLRYRLMPLPLYHGLQISEAEPRPSTAPRHRAIRCATGGKRHGVELSAGTSGGDEWTSER